MTTTHKPKTYGFRISRSGGVYAATAPARRGRQLPSEELYAGKVWREGRQWRNDQCCDRFDSQTDAAEMLMRIIFGGSLTGV
jgi:hypothetical protein